MATRVRAFAVATGATAALAVLATHRPGSLTSGATDPTAPTVTAAAWLAWALAGYLLVAVAASALGHLGLGHLGLGHLGSGPSRPPRRTPVRAAWIAPRVIRRLVDVAVGGTAAALVVAAGAPMAAYADSAPVPAPSSASVPSLDWPTLLTSPAQRRGGPPEEIVVRRGDSLWTLTARRLGPGASSAQVAAAWPRLYAANRAVIGTNPALIRPGQRLVPPASDPRSPS